MTNDNLQRMMVQLSILNKESYVELPNYENFKSLDERFLESTRPTVISKEKK